VKRTHYKYLAAASLLLLSLSDSLAAPGDKPSAVTTVEVVSQPLQEEIPLAGTAEALRESLLSSRVAGVVNEVHVSEGDWVAAGQLILSLDPAIAELEIAAARARVEEAIARQKDAQRRKAEYQSLINRNAVASTSLASAVADEQAARAAVSRQRAELRRFEELLSRHALQAPFAGIVAEEHVEAGQWVKVDSLVVKLVALDRVRVRAALPQRYFRRIDKEAEARVVFDALPHEVFSGKAMTLVGVGNQATRSFPLLIELDNAQYRIAPGMSARIFIELSGDKAKALLVPRDAVLLRADGSRIVWKVNQVEGKYQVQAVKLLVGRSMNGLVEVLDGELRAGDRIVLLGNENLRPGQAVQPQPVD
jgi:RND family efflux transporter MFP subunit